MRRTGKRIIRTLAVIMLIAAVTGMNLGDISVYAQKRARLSKTSAEIYVGKSIKLHVMNSKGRVRWSSSNKKVATVKNGRVKGIKPGHANIFAKTGNVKLVCKVTVRKKPSKLSFDEIPVDEYERAIWYGFVPDAVNGLDPDKTIITWKQMCAMLRNMIARMDASAVKKWDEQIAGAPNKKMKRDGGVIAVLFAARTLDIDYYNIGNNLGEDYDWGHASTWDYPVFDWEGAYALVEADAESGGNRGDVIYGAYSYCFAKRISFVSGKTLFDRISGNPAFDRDMTVRMAAAATVRLYESTDENATRCAECMLEKVLKTEKGKKLADAAEARKTEILNSETKIVKSDTFIQGKTYTGTAYYISNSGNDSNDGKSPKKAWATIDRLITADLKYGDAVFFERGGLWREASLPWKDVACIEGITYSAYGAGEKPRFYGSPENGSGADKWQLVHEGKKGEKIWKFHRKLPDMSAVVMNEGADYAKRDYPYWDGKRFLSPSDFKTPYDANKELKDNEFFIDLAYAEKPYEPSRINIKGFDGNHRIYIEGDLYLRYDKGNPGELFNSIEFATVHGFSDGLAEHTTLDNLHICYEYAPVCGGDTDNYVTMQNSVFAWGGGCPCYYFLNGDYGDAWESRVSMYGEDSGDEFGYCFVDGGSLNFGGSHERALNNYCHHQFQESLALETMVTNDGDCVDNLYKGNLMEYCVMNMTLINWDDEPRDSHIFRNITVEDNMAFYCGFESLYNLDTIKTRKDGNGLNPHFNESVAFWMPRINKHDGTFRVRNNTFAFSTSQLIRLWAYTDEYSHVFDGNTYAQLPGFAFLSKIDYPDRDDSKTEYYTDPVQSIQKWIQDKNATIIQFKPEPT